MNLIRFFDHAQALQAAARAQGLRATVGLESFALQLDGPRGRQSWAPKFMARVQGRLAYGSALSHHTTGFAGWAPYAGRQWPLALDKLAFKQFAHANGLPTPAACTRPQDIGGPFIIKPARGSFGLGLRGPFARHDPQDPAQALQPGEYYENFVLGLIAKAWFWGPHCCAVHLHRPTLITGDGQASVRELVTRLPRAEVVTHDWGLIDNLCRYFGIGSLDAVPPPGKEVAVEYRYGSRYELLDTDNPNLAGDAAWRPVREQFEAAAARLSPHTGTHPGPAHSLFTLDGVVDSQGLLWLLEMNCHPLVHPHCYAAMVETAADPAHTDAP